ncbi:hypothetical protein D3C80_1496770 [compost metagenome]
MVKDTGSMAPSFSASRQNTELAANATRLKRAGQSQALVLRSVSVVVPVLMVWSPLSGIVVIAAFSQDRHRYTRKNHREDGTGYAGVRG